ncbi:hypothetical protein BJ138DRAFT_241570 [Hygrophoropsis aurantiaca]|uniref:Uncharacterized protein n=1 Tax=Hygrophoropsis aurantiaca TaxID=72124 RepID=A0ACB8APL1_9AGAM|nr:hypothetical protein BJ138DRAFT_241570 [Hygrophoropsis aurantiaca]
MCSTFASYLQSVKSTRFMVATEDKRKKPPTYQHLPINRAKKLKQSWVVAKKIKSQWRAQKKKEGLPSRSVSNQDPQIRDDDTQSTKSEKDTDKFAPLKKSMGRSGPTQEPSAKISLREFSRQAYSPRSFHTQKSDSFRQPRDSRNSNGGRREGKRDPRDTGRIKGQPDMGLRMAAMLEKIKRDFT